MYKFLLKTLYVVLGGSVALAAPLVPVQLPWHMSYETIAFETLDGDLDLNEYALAGKNEWYIRTKPKTEAQFESTTSPAAIIGKTLVQIRCERCAYYDEFIDGKQIVRVSTLKTKYDGLRYIKDFQKPEKTGFSNLVEATDVLGAIAWNATTTQGFNNASSVSWAASTAGSDRILLAGATMSDSVDAERDITAATYNSISMVEAAKAFDDTSNFSSEVWYLVAPTTGSNTVSLTFAGTVSTGGGGADSYTGVDQTSPIDATATSTQLNAVSITTNITTNTDNSMVVDYTVPSNGILTTIVGAGQTTRISTFVGGSGGHIDVSEKSAPTAGSYSMSWSCTNGTSGCSASNDWSMAVISLAPVSGAPIIRTGQPIIWYQ